MPWGNAPLCDSCWQHQCVFSPVRIKDPDPEICADCGEETLSGIYVRRMLDAE